MTLTDTASTQLLTLKPGKGRDIPAADCTMTILRAYYRAAKKMGVKISVKSTPDGMRLWRLT